MLKLRLANRIHNCSNCPRIIERGELYWWERSNDWSGSGKITKTHEFPCKVPVGAK